jgi:hypothetical protein
MNIKLIKTKYTAKNTFVKVERPTQTSPPIATKERYLLGSLAEAG